MTVFILSPRVTLLLDLMTAWTAGKLLNRRLTAFRWCHCYLYYH